MKIGTSNTDDSVFLIAEIGNNHEGDFGLAVEMIDAAAEAGADAVKFQTIIPDQLVSASDTNRVEQLTRFQFSEKQFEKLKERTENKNVNFMSTPFDPAAVEWLDRLVPAFKIASGDNDFWPLIDRVCQTGKPLIVSMGLGQSDNASELVEYCNRVWSENGIDSPGISLLHCVVSYPTPDSEAGLGRMASLNLPGVTIGYSDHTIGIRAAELAVAAGARVIEKHFTIDKNYSDFRDHQLSADPEELQQLVSNLRQIEQFFGWSNDQIVQECERGNETPVRRSIAANRNMQPGETVSWEDLCWVRPRVGLKPGEEDKVCGKKLAKPIEKGQAFTVDHIN